MFSILKRILSSWIIDRKLEACDIINIGLSLNNTTDVTGVVSIL